MAICEAMLFQQELAKDGVATAVREAIGVSNEYYEQSERCIQADKTKIRQVHKVISEAELAEMIRLKGPSYQVLPREQTLEYIEMLERIKAAHLADHSIAH